MATCPECEFDEIDTDDFEEGDTLSCPECGKNLVMTGADEVDFADDDDDDDLDDEEEEEDAGPSESDEWCLRAQAVGELAGKLAATLASTGMTDLLHRVELPLVPILAALEQTGIAVDLDVLAEIGDRLDARLRDHEARIYQLAGHEFLINSNPQLQQVLFEELRLPKTKRIKTGYTTDHNALAQLATTDPHPILDALLGYREVAKLKNTYVDALPKLVDKSTGRIHAQFNQLITSTGRLSTQNPNVQNIPIRTETGREIRRAFVAGPDAEGLLVADYAQIEFRVLAHLAGDEALVQAFLGGEDVHATVAGMVWGLPPDQVDRELRARVKMVTYGLAYGLSAYGLAQGIGIAPDEAKALMDTYFARFGKVKDYLDGVVTQARRDGYTSTILGRRRYLPDLTADSYQRRQMAERMALNAPIQGSAADIIKMAMVAVDRAMTATGLRSRMVLQVHDELVFEVAPGEGADLAELVRREMVGVYRLKVPLEVSMATGRSWADAQH
jgi:DNA polymerase-1